MSRALLNTTGVARRRRRGQIDKWSSPEAFRVYGEVLPAASQDGPWIARITNLSPDVPVGAGARIDALNPGHDIPANQTKDVPCVGGLVTIAREWPILQTFTNEWIQQILRTPAALFCLTHQISEGQNGNQLNASATNANIGKLRRSLDDGQSWATVQADINKGGILLYGGVGSMVLAYSHRASGTDYRGRIANSTDEGLTWTQRQDFGAGAAEYNSNFLIGASIPGNPPIYVVKALGASTLYHSLDNGVTWVSTVFNSWRANSSVTTHFNRSVMVSHNNAIYHFCSERTNDSGNPWQMAMYKTTNGVNWTRLWFLRGTHGGSTTGNASNGPAHIIPLAGNKWLITMQPSNGRIILADNLEDTANWLSVSPVPRKPSGYIHVPGTADYSPYAAPMGQYLVNSHGLGSAPTRLPGYQTPFVGESMGYDKDDPLNLSLHRFIQHSGKPHIYDPDTGLTWGTLQEAQLCYASDGGIPPISIIKSIGPVKNSVYSAGQMGGVSKITQATNIVSSLVEHPLKAIPAVVVAYLFGFDDIAGYADYARENGKAAWEGTPESTIAGPAPLIRREPYRLVYEAAEKQRMLTPFDIDTPDGGACHLFIVAPTATNATMSLLSGFANHIGGPINFRYRPNSIQMEALEGSVGNIGSSSALYTLDKVDIWEFSYQGGNGGGEFKFWKNGVQTNSGTSALTTDWPISRIPQAHHDGEWFEGHYLAAVVCDAPLSEAHRTTVYNWLRGKLGLDTPFGARGFLRDGVSEALLTLNGAVTHEYVVANDADAAVIDETGPATTGLYTDETDYLTNAQDFMVYARVWPTSGQTGAYVPFALRRFCLVYDNGVNTILQIQDQAGFRTAIFTGRIQYGAWNHIWIWTNRATNTIFARVNGEEKSIVFDPPLIGAAEQLVLGNDRIGGPNLSDGKWTRVTTWLGTLPGSAERLDIENNWNNPTTAPHRNWHFGKFAIS